MSERFVRIGLVAALVLLAAFVAEPYIARYFLAETTPRTVAARGDLTAAERSTIQLFQNASPSVVHVFGRGGIGRNPFAEEGGAQQSGSGFIWDPAGHVVTNNHVVQGASEFAVRLASGDIVGAELVGTAPNFDLAVLRIGRTRQPLQPLAIGTSADLKVGQAAFAIGNPFGLDQTLTAGVISALQRRLPTGQGREISDVIQTDAPINPGNSGGPLLDSAGRVIGVNTAIFSPSGAFAGIGFAVPIDVVNRVVPQLIQRGRVPSPGIGILAGQEGAAARLGVEGVIIFRVLPGSPAERAGLRGIDPQTGEIGDIIVAVNGKPVRRLADLTAALDRTGIGKPAQLTVQRGGRQVQVEVEVTDISRERS